MDKLEKTLESSVINAKIDLSKKQNKVRIDKMAQINKTVESLLHDAKVEMNVQIQDKEVYGKLIKNLLVQGLIKLMEPSVLLKVRECDVDIIKEQIDDAIAEYKEAILKEVKDFEGQSDLKCKIQIDETNFLPDWNEHDLKNSCLGGFEMFAKKNRIVCSQTLDARMELVYAMAIPAIREMLFPSLAKKKKN